MSWAPEAARARDALLSRVGAALAGAGRETPVVLVDGPSGGGKSSLADFLVERWPGPLPPTLVRMDDLYPGWDGLDAGSAALASSLLEPLARNGLGRWRRWDWAAEHPAEWHAVTGPAPLLVEGCGTLSRAGREHAHLSLWLDAEDGLRRRRAIGRDGEVYARHWDGWQRDFERYCAREEPASGAQLRLDVTDWPIGTPPRRASGSTVVP